jgi:hypothetical protein
MDVKTLAKLLLPLILIPLTLYAVSLFGHAAGNLIIGAAFLIGIVKFAEKKERRFMVMLAIFSLLLEGVNVALGSYKYIGVMQIPPWIGMGWGVVGLYLLKNLKMLRQANDKAAYAIAIVAYIAVWAATGADIPALIPLAFAILSVYVLAISSNLPASFFLSAGLLAVVIEYAGTAMKIWSYFDAAGNVVSPSYASLSLAYASVIAFALWASGAD